MTEVPGGQITIYQYKNADGVLHRDGDQPAFVSVNKDLGVTIKQWFTNGVNVRGNGERPETEGSKPATVTVLLDGRVRREWNNDRGERIAETTTDVLDGDTDEFKLLPD